MPGEPEPLGLIALVLLGLGGILAVSMAFYAVGRSEDRDRAAAERADRDARFTSPRTTNGDRPPRRPAARRRDHG